MNHICLLGDSIFDNAAYVGSGLDVIEQLGSLLPAGWKTTLLAVDGSVTANVREQLDRLPPDATHLVVSAGGNDGLSQLDVLDVPVTTVAGALQTLARITAEFDDSYGRMLTQLLAANKPLALCTIYDSCQEDRLTQAIISTALHSFNDRILRAAIKHGLPVLDLRTICTEKQHYANPIEPSEAGGMKIARAILRLVQTHDFSIRRTTIYPGPADCPNRQQPAFSR